MPDRSEQPVVLVTGSEGLIGKAVSEGLRSHYHVVGTDRQAPYEGEAEDFVMMDVASEAGVKQALDSIRARYGNRIASVVHLIAYYDFSGAESPLYHEITVEGTRRLLQGLKADFEVEQFIFSSSTLVHAPCTPGGHIDEDSPLEPKWAYPRSKVETEQLIHAERGDLHTVILRVAGIYTAWGQQPTLVQQIKRIYEKNLESHLFPGNPDTGQALVHVDDAIDAIVRTVDRRTKLPEEVTLLIGENDPPSYAQLQDTIGQQIWGHEWKTLRIPEIVAEAGAWVKNRLPGADMFIKPYMIALADDHFAFDTRRARDLLGWHPRHHLLDTLPRIVQKLLDDPQSWYEHNGLDPSDAKGEGPK